MSEVFSAEQLWPAPAKLNLFLHITGRRADGYHELQTVFQFLDYGDDLSFEIRNDGSIERRHSLTEVSQEQDLTVRAARLLKAETGTPLGTSIHLHKRIPLGGGLGGGSSDAATTLVALNHLWKTGLSTARLAELGQSLGADVPVFVHGHSAWAEGTGDKLRPLNLDEPWFLVVTPEVAVSTGEIFNAPELRRDCATISEDDFRAGRCGNVCEPVTFARYPPVREAHAALAAHGRARMSGTGASCFTSFQTRDAARLALESLPRHWNSFVARGLNPSPLLQSISRTPQL